MAYKRLDWNDLVTRVNDVLTNPPEGCDPLPPLPLVDPNHKWASGDILAVHDALRETCPDITFEEIPPLWKQSIIDDIEAALNEAWCDCEECECEDEDIVVLSMPIPHIDCGVHWAGTHLGSPFCTEAEAGFFDWYSLVQEIEGFGTGIGGSFQLVQRAYNDLGTIPHFTYGIVYSNVFDCSGQQKFKTPPTAAYIQSRGRLPVVSIHTHWGGAIDSEPARSNAIAQHELLQADMAADLALNPMVEYVIRKRCPEEFVDGKGPCKECCEDGKGFVGIDCPAPPPDED